MMKKCTAFFVLLTMLLGCFTVASAANGVDQVMNSFNILPASCTADSDKTVTRAEFAYTLANILGSGEVAPRETGYLDVTEELPDSGYIYFATINGFLIPTGTNFCPNDAISFDDYNRAIIKLLAYERIAEANGGNVAANVKTMRDLGMYNGVEVSDYSVVTVKQYRKLIYNLLTAKVSDFNYSYDEQGNVTLKKTGTTKTILSEYFNISRYNAQITVVNDDAQTVKAVITKNVSASNPTPLTVGETYDFSSNGKVDLNFYANIPIELWADSEGQIVYLAPQDNVRVFYDTIVLVNRDDDPDEDYTMSEIRNMEFGGEDKEYKVDSGAELRYNGVMADAAPLAGNYAKIVMIDNKVTFVETWDLKVGGLVQEITNSYITFNNGEAVARVNELNDYDSTIVVVEGVSTDRSQIKTGSIISYYKDPNKNLLVLVLSEKTIVGRLNSITEEELEIGRHFYSLADNVFYSENGVDYEEVNISDVDASGEQMKRIFANEVTAYFDVFGKACYLKSTGALGEDNTFIGYVIGSVVDGFEGRKVKMQKVYPDFGTVEAFLPVGFDNYVDNPATNLPEDVTESTLRSNFLTPLNWAIHKDDAYRKLYKVSLDESGEITKIAEPDFFLLYGEEHTAEIVQDDGTVIEEVVPAIPVTEAHIYEVPNDTKANIFLPLNADGSLKLGNAINSMNDVFASGQYFDYNKEPIIVLQHVDGKTSVEKFSYDDLRAIGAYTNARDFKFAMLAAPGASIPDFWFVYGDTNRLSGYGSSDSAVIKSITRAYDAENDEVYYNVAFEGEEETWRLDSLVQCPIRYYVTDPTTGTYVLYNPEGDNGSLLPRPNPPTELAVGMTVTYRSRAMFSANEVMIEYAREAYPTIETFEDYAKNELVDCIRGTLKKITDHRIFLENGAAYHINSSGVSIKGIRIKNGKVEELSLSESDIPVGATVYLGNKIYVRSIVVDMSTAE